MRRRIDRNRLQLADHLAAQRVDFIEGLDLIANDLPALQAISADQTVAITGLLDEFLTFNQGNNMKGCAAPYDQTKCGTPTIFVGDKVLRQAINLAIDKNAINQNLVHNVGVVAVLLSAAFFFAEFTVGPIWAIPMDIAPRAAGAASGLMNSGSAIR